MTRIMRHRGFTLIELLVVVTIVTILIALILPAMQAARESARRIHCVSQAKNIVLAINHHVEAKGLFPGGLGKPYDASYIVQILPYVEQQPLYNSINMTNGADATLECNENATAILTSLSTFLCPSDSSRSNPLSASAPNYAANAGSGNLFADDGPMISATTSPRDVTDGLSQTAGVVEWIVGGGDYSNHEAPFGGTRLGSVYLFDQPLPKGDLLAFTRACDALEPGLVRLNPPGFKGFLWVVRGLGRTQYNHTLTPNRPSCVGGGCWAATAGSFHRGGVNVASLDGAVRFVKDSVDPSIWRAAGTRAGSEVVGPME